MKLVIGGWVGLIKMVVVFVVGEIWVIVVVKVVVGFVGELYGGGRGWF